MLIQRVLVVTACAAAMVAGGAAAASAGEIKGPPGTPGVAGSATGEATGALLHANSICAASGLNDMTLGEGPIDTITQTPKGTRGAPGTACRGGSNEERLPR